MTATIFDATRKSGNCSLTVGSTVASFSGLGQVGTNNRLLDRAYYEVVATTLTGVLAVGFCCQQINWASGSVLGTDNNSLVYKSDGTVKLNGVTLATLATYVQGDNIGVAVDPYTQQVWFRVNGGNWNNSSGNSPVTNVGGIDYSTLNPGVLYGAFGCTLTGAVFTKKFDTTDYSYTAPTGFVSPTAGLTPNTNMSLKYKLESITTANISAVTTGWSTLWFKPKTLYTPAGPMKYVSGVTKQLGTVIGGVRLFLYDQTTGDKIGETSSATGTGLYSIPAKGHQKVFVVGFDPPTFQAICLDQIVPT
jgi:hypothetical protein